MCPEHRLKIIEEVKKALTSGLRTVCVSTQLIEAGVNLSFQCVIRSLAGLDNIAQAAGRCNRHGEASCRDVYVINSNAEDLRKLPDIFWLRRALKGSSQICAKNEEKWEETCFLHHGLKDIILTTSTIVGKRWDTE